MTEVNLKQMLVAYDYAESHPHKYLRGTTNWCAAVAHSLNQQLAPLSPAHIEDGEEVEVVAWQHPQYPERIMTAEHKAYNESRDGAPATVAKPYTVALMTVAQHQRIVAALSAPPAADGMCNADNPGSRCECREEFGHRVCTAPPAAGVLEGWRELAQGAAEALQVFTGHDSGPNLRHRYGENWWEPLNQLRDKLRAMLAAAPTPPASEQRTVEELRVLREYRDACIGFNNSLGAEAETPEDALWLERQAEARLEAAESACHAFYAAPTPPASEQQRAVVMPAETLANLHSLLTELQWQWKPHDDHWHTPMGHYCPDCGAEKEAGHHQNCAIASMLAEFLRLNPHLAKGKGV